MPARRTTPSRRPPPDATTRFSSRVADYAAYRPHYPAEVYRFLASRLGVGRCSIVADLGSGTGIFAAPLLDAGCVVYGVEPNREMRQEAERTLKQRFPTFHSVSGTAEATSLPDASVDVVVAAQAFHWFDPAKAAAKCRRILRAGGNAVIVWNTRKTDGSAFLRGYEHLLNQLGTDYAAVRHDRNEPERLRVFFRDGFERVVFPNAQRLDLRGLRGRVLSSSYTPAADDPGRPVMLAALDRLFEEHEDAGAVTVDYDTELYFGRP